jgi:hypothetical protein
MDNGEFERIIDKTLDDQIAVMFDNVWDIYDSYGVAYRFDETLDCIISKIKEKL